MNDHGRFRTGGYGVSADVVGSSVAPPAIFAVAPSEEVEVGYRTRTARSGNKRGGGGAVFYPGSQQSSRLFLSRVKN